MNRLDKAICYTLDWNYEEVKKVLKCLSKGTRVIVRENHRYAIKDFPELKITLR